MTIYLLEPTSMGNLKNFIPYRMIRRISIEEGTTKRAIVYTTDGESFDIQKDKVDIIPGSRWDLDWITGVMTEIKKEIDLHYDATKYGATDTNNIG